MKMTITFLKKLIEKRNKQINNIIDAGLYQPYKNSIIEWYNDITEAEIEILKIRRTRLLKKLK